MTVRVLIQLRIDQNPYGGSNGVIYRAAIICPVTLLKVRLLSVSSGRDSDSRIVELESRNFKMVTRKNYWSFCR